MSGVTTSRLYDLFEDVLGLPHTGENESNPSMAEAFDLPVATG